ncbi:MAG: SRPBCC domain-containing protein [Candidatus Dormiibacterota bacterium]
MTINRHGSATLEFPSDREMLTTRKFDASAELLFDVLTKPEHVTVWFTGGDEGLEVCEIDLRVGGDYRYVGVIAGGAKCSFHGTFLQIERPTRLVNTWVFDGRPEAEAVETVTLQELDGVTTMTTVLAFRDQASLDSMFQHAPGHRDDPAVAIDGQQASFDKLEDYLASLL